MEVLQNILILMLLLAGVVLIVVLTKVLLRVGRTIEEMKKELMLLNSEIRPLVHRLERVAEQGEAAVAILNESRDGIRTAVANVRWMSERTRALYEMVHTQIEPPLRAFATTLAGLRRGVDTFSTTWKKR
jgi:uncharacterized protein YoxC